MAYDSTRQTVVLFGGDGLGDFWEFDGSTWAPIFCAQYPSPRGNSALAYDEGRQRLVLFDGALLADTWEFDGNDWLVRQPPTSPPARAGHGMAFDTVRQRTVLFGGRPWPGGSWMHDTWEWDGVTWLNVGPTNPAPTPRTEHSLTFDALAQRVLVTGGRNASYHTIALNQPQEWDGVNWTGTGTNPAGLARSHHAMVFESARQRVFLFGGTNHATLSPFLGDTWVNRTVTASVQTYGAGCGTTPLTFTPTSRPILGQSGTATISNSPTNIGAVALGWSNQAFGPFQLPVTLAGVGMPGCLLHQSAEVLGIPITVLAPNALELSLQLPNQPSLLNAHAYLQAYAIAPNVNPAWVITSNAIDWLIGDV